MADAAPHWTPFRFCFNNPITVTDPTGMLEDPNRPTQDAEMIAISAGEEDLETSVSSYYGDKGGGRKPGSVGGNYHPGSGGGSGSGNDNQPGYYELDNEQAGEFLSHYTGGHYDINQNEDSRTNNDISSATQLFNNINNITSSLAPPNTEIAIAAPVFIGPLLKIIGRLLAKFGNSIWKAATKIGPKALPSAGKVTTKALTNLVKIGQIEDGVMTFSSKIGEEAVEGITNFAVKDGKLLLDKLHIGGSGAGKIGRAELWNMIKDLGKQFNVKEVIIQGGKRTTGKYKGQVPSPITVKID